MSAGAIEAVAPVARSGRREGARAAPVLLGAMAGSLVAARFETALAMLAAAGLAGAWAGARVPARGWFAAVGGAAGVAIVFNLWLAEGRALPIPPIAGHAATLEGLALGALLGLRLAGAALAIHGLRAAWPGQRAADEVARRLAPLERIRVPVREARAVLGLALRVAPLLEDEVRRIGALQTLRAGRPPRGPAERLERGRATLVPVMVGALERAERMALALEARHWRVRALPPAGRPGLATLVGLALLGVSIAWRAG
jgi:energy-coupling factor transport system permease protein